MTRENYIENLQSMINDAEDLGLYDEDVESLRVAIKALEQEPCDDCISRETARRIVDSGRTKPQMIDMILATPPVNPQPKTGRWIYKQYGGYPEQGDYHCSECDNIDNRTPSYCPSCGAKMVESQESEDKE